MVAFSVHSSPALPFQVSRSSFATTFTSCRPFYIPMHHSVRLEQVTQSQSRRNANITLSLSRERAILTIDVGTSATKAALCFIDQQGQLGTLARIAHETHMPADLNVIQYVNDWVEGAIEASRQALSDAPCAVDVCAIAVSGQMQNLIAVGPRTPPLLSSHAILYSDARAQEAAADLSTQCSTSIDATSILAKLTLLPTHSSPSDYSLLLGAADYIIHHFCNSPKPTVTDATTASTTGLTLPPHRTYNTLLLQEANLAHFESLLPRILSSPCIVGHLSLTIAQRLDKPSLAGTPLIHAGGDAYSTTAGAERETPGGAYVYCGTSGWIGGTTLAASPTHNGVFALGHAADSRLQIALASLATAGGNVSFAAKTLLGGVNENLVCNMADQAPIGANGVMYIPYICGRRCPNPCATMSGTLVGLRGSTTRRDVARAVVEGIVFAYAEAAEVLEKGILDGEMLRMVGGGARCGVVVRGIASLIGKNGGVVLEKGEGGYVGVRGCGKIGAEVVCGERGMDWWRDGEIVKVGEGEKREWMKAWRRWRRALERVEGV